MTMHQGREFSCVAQEPSRTSAMARPLRLPYVPAAWARWCTEVLGADLAFGVTVGGVPWTWRPVPHALPHSPAPAVWACVLHGTVGGQPFSCWLDSVAPLTVHPLREQDLPCLPEALMAAVVQDVAADTLAQWNAALGQRVELHSVSCSPQDALALDEGLAFTLTRAASVQDGGRGTRTVRGLLAATWPHPLFAPLQTQARNGHESGVPQTLPVWPVPCAVGWSTRPLALADIRALEKGDVLLMPPHAAPKDGAESEGLPVRVRVGSGAKGGGAYFAARWSAVHHTVTLESDMQQEKREYAEDAVQGCTPQDAEESLFDQCRVPVRCVLGEVEISLAALAKLGPGAVLGPLDTVDAPVSLWLGTTRIGTGSLVDMDGRVGVRVIEMASAAVRGNT